MLANAWDRGSAQLLAALGAEAIGTTSSGFAFTRGLPDGGRVSLDDAIGHAADLASVTRLPVSADLENGYGATPAEVGETIRRSAAAGLAGCSIEDTVLGTGDSFDFGEALERVSAAVVAARTLDDDFILVARADGVLRRNYAVDDAIERVKAFASVGADCVYIPWLPDLAAVERVCAAVDVPVNVLVVGSMTAHRRQDFADAGVARLSLGAALARVTHRALIDAAGAMLEEGDVSLLGPARQARQSTRCSRRGRRRIVSSSTGVSCGRVAASG